MCAGWRWRGVAMAYDGDNRWHIPSFLGNCDAEDREPESRLQTDVRGQTVSVGVV